MNKLIPITALALLAACKQQAEQPPAPVETASVAALPADVVGSYDVKMADGTLAKTVINADGTYVDTDAKGKQVKGTFAQKDGKDCFDPEGDEAESCWSMSAPAADGSMVATAPDGKTKVTVSRSKS